MSAPVDPVVQADQEQWESSVSETNYLMTQERAQMEARAQELLGMMSNGVNASLACHYLIPLLMLVGGNITGLNDVSIPASEANTETSVEDLTTLTTSDDTYLASNADNYNSMTQEMNSGGTLTSTQQDEYNQYNNTYNQAQQAQATLSWMFSANSTDGSPYEGWCDESYADNMIAAINSWQSATTDLSTNHYTPGTGYEFSSSGAGQTPTECYALHLQEYSEDPSSFAYSGDITNLSTSLNTETTSNSSIQAQIQGLEKMGLAEIQQLEGSTKSLGDSVVKERQAFVDAQQSR